MSRTFEYRFDPPDRDPLAGSATTALTVQEIEDAGLRETLQAPGLRFATWSTLAGLLDSGRGDTPFLFARPPSRARAMRDALSGLFARFVARAWLERHLSLVFFAHPAAGLRALAGSAAAVVRRSAGELPEWLAAGAGPGRLAFVAAGGSFATAGPATALDRAWERTGRVEFADQPDAIADRIAVALRWGVRGRTSTTALHVRAGTDAATPAVAPAPHAAVVRGHFANLLDGLGYPHLAAALRAVSAAPGAGLANAARAAAHATLAAAKSTFVEGVPTAHLVGRVLTRAGPTTALHVTDNERRALARLRWHPQVVGIERGALAAAIDGATIADTGEPPLDPFGLARRDRAGLWIIPLGSRLAQAAPSGD